MSLNDINNYHIQAGIDSVCAKIQENGIYKNKKIEIGKILRKLCEWKGVKMIEAEICPDHVHMLVEIPSKISLSGFMGY